MRKNRFFSLSNSKLNKHSFSLCKIIIKTLCKKIMKSHTHKNIILIILYIIGININWNQILFYPYIMYIKIEYNNYILYYKVKVNTWLLIYNQIFFIYYTQESLQIQVNIEWNIYSIFNYSFKFFYKHFLLIWVWEFFLQVNISLTFNRKFTYKESIKFEIGQFLILHKDNVLFFVTITTLYTSVS